jgi:hypothetical protein
LNNPGDNVFNFGTGPLSLEQGETQRFSMCILFGNDLQELILNAETATRNYLKQIIDLHSLLQNRWLQQFQVMEELHFIGITDQKVQLTRFQGKWIFKDTKIYRSRDYTFSDVFTITDAGGNPFLGEGIAQFDVVDSLSGLHPVEYLGRGIKYNVGSNSGLVHEFVDSTVTNGINITTQLLLTMAALFVPDRSFRQQRVKRLFQEILLPAY